MSDSRRDFPARNAAPASVRSAPDEAASRVAKADGERCSQFGMDYDVGSDTHTLLSHPPASEGRRSLFRR